MTARRPSRPTSQNPARADDVYRAALAAGLADHYARTCARAAEYHDWITVRRTLITAQAAAHERTLREAYYGPAPTSP